MKLIRSDIYENLKMALATLRGNKPALIPDCLGVMIGVITVMLISSIISGVDTAVKKETRSHTAPTQSSLSSYNPAFTSPVFRVKRRMRKDLTYDDAVALTQLPAVELSVPFLDISNNFFGSKITVSSAGKTSAAVSLQGTLPDFERAGTQIIKEGRFFTQYENDNNEEVCVVGSSVGTDFFPFGSPVGQTIGIGGNQFRVVGVLEKRTFCSRR